ncbi:uncharacterized protein [Physcomitrium patens]|uniref:BHLH domain-containing protein n=1 Tax=Physcomitrium patens TaxID=3218 RepID=A0A2K1IZ25_PHYPA|nr:hypothetical protein PHYPA_024346 [Physcomitrium patens]
MDYPDVVEFSTSKTFWNSEDALLDSFYKPLASTMASMEGSCCSTLLFPSTSSTCDNGGNNKVFKRPYQQTILDEKFEGGAESRGISESCCANASAGSVVDTSQCSWISGSPLFHGAEGMQFCEIFDNAGLRVQFHHRDVSHTQDQLGAFNSSAHVGSDSSIPRDFDHDFDSQAFHNPLMQQSSFRHPEFDLQLVTKQRNAKASWLSPRFHASMSLDLREMPHNKHPGSQCSTTAGFTKVLHGAEPASSDHNMESFGRLTIAASDESKNIKSHEANAPSEGATPSVSGMHEGSGIMHNLEPKRKRSKTQKHGDEVESQRMTHIAVERNRRKQMNEHLTALRALMPGYFIQKGDQASIIGGAIEFVRELEHLLHCLQAQKRQRAQSDISNLGNPSICPPAMPSLDQLHRTLPPLSFINSQGVSTDTHSSSNTTRNSHNSRFYSPHRLPVSPTLLPAPPSSPTLDTKSWGRRSRTRRA